MKQFLTVLCALLCFPMLTRAQYEVEQVFSDDQRTAPGFQDNRRNRSDSIQSQHKVVPRGLKVWTVDERFGDRTPAVPRYPLLYVYELHLHFGEVWGV